MFKNFVVTVAALAALTTGSQAFANQADLVITSARLIPHVVHPEIELVVRNQGRGQAASCVLEAKLIGTATQRFNASGFFGCAPLAAGETKVVRFALPIALHLRLATIAAGQIVYFQATADCTNRVKETWDVSLVSIERAFTYDGEANNTLSFNAVK